MTTATQSRTETIGDFVIRYEPEEPGDACPWVIRDAQEDDRDVVYDTAATRRDARKAATRAMAERMQEAVCERIGRVKDLDRLRQILDLIG